LTSKTFLLPQEKLLADDIMLDSLLFGKNIKLILKAILKWNGTENLSNYQKIESINLKWLISLKHIQIIQHKSFKISIIH
jgi:hypothetical protein